MVFPGADLQHLHGGVWPQCASHALHHQLLALGISISCVWTLHISKLCSDISDCGGAGESGGVQQGVRAAAADPGYCQSDRSSSCR